MSHALTECKPSSTQRLMAWVSNPATVADDGRILSWVNTKNSGFPYDEATAFYARLHTWLGNARQASALGNILEKQIAENGWLMRDNTKYAFDTAIALPVLMSPDIVIARIVSLLTAGRACDPITRPGWWSQSYGAHLIKSLVPLAACGRRALANELANDLVDKTFDGQRFRIHADSSWTYLHSHCYATEGLIGLGIHDDVVHASARWLAEMQADNGSLPAWVGGVVQPPPADIVAQSIRIWTLVDPRHYAVEISRGLTQLDHLQDPHTGGICYSLDSGHINSWSSAFALQAKIWAQRPPATDELEWLL